MDQVRIFDPVVCCQLGHSGAVLRGDTGKGVPGHNGVLDGAAGQAEDLARGGKTPLLFARDGALLGMIAVADAIKPDSPRAVAQLR